MAFPYIRAKSTGGIQTVTPVCASICNGSQQRQKYSTQTTTDSCGCYRDSGASLSNSIQYRPSIFRGHDTELWERGVFQREVLCEIWKYTSEVQINTNETNHTMTMAPRHTALTCSHLFPDPLNLRTLNTSMKHSLSQRNSHGIWNAWLTTT